MKNIKCLLVAIIFLLTIRFNQSIEKRIDVSSMLAPDNPYYHGAFKNNNALISPHSAFTSTNSNSDMMSTYPYAVPQPKNKNFLTPNDANFNLSNMNPEDKLANKIVNDYRKKFNFIDNDRNNVISDEELAKAFENFKWPKKMNGVKDNKEYAKKELEMYDKDKKGSLSFPEFTDFMIDLWKVSEQNNEETCKKAMEKTNDVFKKLFDWLDKNKAGKITGTDMLFGLSKIMYKDAKKNEIEKVMTRYGTETNPEDSKNNPNPDKILQREITYDQFLLAIANGLLDNTLKG